jgi:hypothetical protein
LKIQITLNDAQAAASPVEQDRANSPKVAPEARFAISILTGRKAIPNTPSLQSAIPLACSETPADVSAIPHAELDTALRIPKDHTKPATAKGREHESSNGFVSKDIPSKMPITHSIDIALTAQFHLTPRTPTTKSLDTATEAMIAAVAVKLIRNK